MLTIQTIDDPEFRAYGKVLEGYDTKELLEAMMAIPLPEGGGVAYEAAIPSLEACAVMQPLETHAYAGQPIEIGMCWGKNTHLNCLEYHRDSELNIGTHDYILLVAKMEEIVDGVLDTSKVKAFRVPAGVVLEVYETTLHYAPCHVDPETGFRVAIVLPRGTNVGGTGKPAFEPLNDEDRRLWGRNKWILAHPDTNEAAQGAYVGLKGENVDIAPLL